MPLKEFNLSEEFHRLSCDVQLDARSKYLRRLIFRALAGGKRGHVGSALSLVEIFRVLYDDVITYDASNPSSLLRDRVILSKGHGCLALYAILADKGFFALDHLDTFCQFDSILGGHPEVKTPGVEVASGSLGHGLAIGVGIALALRIKKRTERVYVVVGDGEINEGSIWESALSANKHRLNNLTVLIDYNKMQSYGRTVDVVDLEPLEDKWNSFGFMVQHVNGHNVDALKIVLKKIECQTHGKPQIVICHTVKGKGLSIAENNASWHHKSHFSQEEIQIIQNEFNQEEKSCAPVV